MTDTITITRDTAGYYLTGTYGAARVVPAAPLAAEHVAGHVRAFPRARIVADLPDGDPLASLARPARRGGRR